MGNKGSVNSEPTMVSYGQSQREENAYDIPWRTTFTQSASGISPPVPPRGLERRAMTVTARERHHESPVGGQWVGGFKRKIAIEGG